MNPTVSVLCIRKDVAPQILSRAVQGIANTDLWAGNFLEAHGADRIYLCRPSSPHDEPPHEYHDECGDLLACVLHFETFEAATTWMRADIRERSAWLTARTERGR